MLLKIELEALVLLSGLLPSLAQKKKGFFWIVKAV